MSTLLFASAAVLLLIALALFWLDAQQRRQPVATPEPLEEQVQETATEPDQATEWYENPEEDLDVSAEEALAEVEEVPTAHLPEVEHVSAELEDVPALRPQATVMPSEQPTATKSGFRHFPGAGRREKRAWAEQHGYDYMKADPFLDEEWTRGAASEGATAKDVVTGVYAGQELHLLELGGNTVMALRRNTPSAVVVDARRQAESLQEDLMLVARESGFQISSTDPGAARRMIDQRVIDGLAAMPERVQAVWVESDWVLAQLEKGSDHADWDALRAALLQISYAAYVLPPRSTAQQPIELHDFDPTRPMLRPDFAQSSLEDEVADLPSLPPVEQTPAPRIELPTRATGQRHGEVESHVVGTDSLPAIGDGSVQAPPNDFQGTRVLRDPATEATIFDDIAAEFGSNPLKDAD